MNDDGLKDAVRAHLTDQAEANMVTLGRGYATFYRTLVEQGVPPVLAADLVQRQQSANLQIAIRQAVGGGNE